MARTRYLKPGFFQNDQLAELGPWHRLLFAGLWTIADRCGRLEDRPKRIKGELFPYDAVDVDALLSDLSAGADPFVVRYEVNGVRYLSLPKFLAHQKIHANEAPSVIPACPFGAKSEKQTEKLNFATNGQAVRTKVASETHQGDDEHALNLNSNSNSNGDSNGDTNAVRTAARPVGSEREARQHYGRPLVGSPLEHRSHGWCNQRGLCLPASLYAELLGRLGQDRERELLDWLGATIDALTGVPGENVWVFWRTRFEQWQGSSAPVKGHRPSPQPAYASDYFEECQRLHSGRCNGQSAHAMQMRIDAGRANPEAEFEQIAAFMGGGKPAVPA